MIAALLGRFFRFCIRQAEAMDEIATCGFEDLDYMTDQEISAAAHGRGHTVDWNEVRRRKLAGEVKTQWHPRDAAGAGA